MRWSRNWLAPLNLSHQLLHPQRSPPPPSLNRNVWCSSRRISVQIPIIHEPSSWCAKPPNFSTRARLTWPTSFSGLGCGSNRAQDRLFLGPSHEVVPCRRGGEGSQSTRGQTLCVSERRYVIPFFYPILLNRTAIAALAATGFIWVRYSFVIIPVNYSLAAVSERYVPTSAPVPSRFSCVVL